MTFTIPLFATSAERRQYMKPKPMLMSTPMVQATLEGIKTQTRRVAKVPIDADAYWKQGGLVWYDPMQNQETKRCPRYLPGDIVYVRETWCNVSKHEYKPEYYYRADANNCEDYDPSEWKWRPSIHMPREAARLFLRITGVRAERLQEINDANVTAEGISWDMAINGYHARKQFIELWNTLNPKADRNWNANPWVWVYTFERITQNLKFTDQDTAQYANQPLLQPAT